MEEPQQPGKKSNRAILGIVALVIIVGLISGAAVYQQKHKTTQSDESTTPSSIDATNSSTNTAATTPAPAGTYKDGTYTAEGTYNSPGHDGKISVSITLKDNLVRGSTVTGEAIDPQSKEYQSDFIGGYKALVTGKDISTIKLGKVSGSSLTATGFNAALETIKTQAKA